MRIDFDDNIPIYLQIIDAIKSDIIAGIRKPGEKLASVRELSQSLEVNPNTVQRAYMELEREGIMYTQRGLGGFITQDCKKIEQLKSKIAYRTVDDFLLSMERLGYDKKELVRLIMEHERGGEDNNG